METNLNQFFQTIGNNSGHPLTQAAEQQYGNGKKVTISPLMMRYDSTGYTTGIDSFIHRIVLQKPQPTPRKFHHKVAEIDTTKLTQSTAKMNFLKAVQTPSRRSNDTKESPESKASNFFNTPSAIQTDDSSLSGGTLTTSQTIETLRTEFTMFQSELGTIKDQLSISEKNYEKREKKQNEEIERLKKEHLEEMSKLKEQFEKNVKSNVAIKEQMEKKENQIM